VSTKQLYLSIRLPSSSSTSVPLLNSSSTYVSLLSSSSTSVPLYLVVVHLYHYKPRSSTGVLFTIIGLSARPLYLFNNLISIFTHSLYPQKCNNRVSNKGGNQTTKTKCFHSLTLLALLTKIIYCKYIQNKGEETTN